MRAWNSTLPAGKPLRRGQPLERETRLKSRRGRERRNAVKDPARRAWLVTQPCAALSLPGHVCEGRMTINHVGPKGTRHDRDGIPQCWHSHMVDYHGARGDFSGWTVAQRREWASAQVVEHRARYEREAGSRGIAF